MQTYSPIQDGTIRKEIDTEERRFEQERNINLQDFDFSDISTSEGVPIVGILIKLGLD